MSEPTLYRDLGCRHLRVCDSAVPVEPDYEAAMVTFQVVASGAIGLGLEPAVRAIVDAAYGIGGTP